MTKASAIPFTDEGLVEATSRQVTTETFDDAWRRVVRDTPYLTEPDRAEVLSASNGTVSVRRPTAYRPGWHLTVDRRVVAVQGGWWYRGVTSVEPHADGSVVTYTVVNVARGWGRWVAHLFQARGHRRQIETGRAESPGRVWKKVP